MDEPARYVNSGLLQYMLLMNGVADVFDLSPKQLVKRAKSFKSERELSVLSTAPSPYKMRSLRQDAAASASRAASAPRSPVEMFADYVFNEDYHRTLLTFIRHISRERFIPTRDVLASMPSLDLELSTRETIFVTCPDIEIGSLRRISESAYVARACAGGLVFILRTYMTFVLLEQDICRLSHYVMRWISSFPNVPPKLKITATAPLTDVSKKIAEEVLAIARRYSNERAFAFYLESLIPYVAQNMERIKSAVLHQKAAAEASDEDDALSDDNECIICRMSMNRGETCLDYECLHAFHKECANAWQTPACPVCRSPKKRR